MDADERARLRALCEAATPGPWDASYDEDAGEWMVRAGHADVAVLTWQQALDALGLSPVTRRTAAIIAASRTAIPALLDDSERLDAVTRERDEARAEAERLRARLHRCAQCGAEECAVAACEGDEYPLCGPCAAGALREARAEAVAARAHTDRAVDEIRRTLPAALRLAAEDEREACAAIADKYAAQEDVAGADACGRVAVKIRARGTGGAR